MLQWHDGDIAPTMMLVMTPNYSRNHVCLLKACDGTRITGTHVHPNSNMAS